MAGIGVIWVRASTLEKMQAELDQQLAHYQADDVVGISHSTGTVASKQSGGIWAAARTTYEIEYTALVLVRTA